MKALISELKQTDVSYLTGDTDITFLFNHTPVKQYFTKTSEYSLKRLVQDVNNLVKPDLTKSLDELFTLLTQLYSNHHEKYDFEKIQNNSFPVALDNSGNLDRLPDILTLDRSTLEDLTPEELSRLPNEFFGEKNKRRTWMSRFSSSKVSVSLNTPLNLLIHHSSADLSILSDFEEFKNDLTLVNSTFVTLGKPLKYEGSEVIIRDTQLLVPGGKKSLDALSDLYPDIKKIKISPEDITNMDKFYERDPEGFKAYAIRDALITLVHGCFMSKFNQELGGKGVPVTLSSLSQKFLKKSWKKMNYQGYQPFPQLLLALTCVVQSFQARCSVFHLQLAEVRTLGSCPGSH